MKFEWDENKRNDNIRKHGFDFTDAEEMFNAPMLVVPDNRFDYGEERFIGIGLINGRIAVLVWTERGEKERVIRIISIRKALKSERETYEKEIIDRLETY